MKKEKTIDDYIYVSIILTIILLLILYLIYIMIGKPSIFNCKIYDTWGIYCPGCGCTRALICLFQGDVIGSFLYNPAVLYAVIVTSFYIVSRTIGKIARKEESKFIMKYNPIYLYIGIGMLIGACIIKNIIKVLDLL